MYLITISAKENILNIPDIDRIISECIQNMELQSGNIRIYGYDTFSDRLCLRLAVINNTPVSPTPYTQKTDHKIISDFVRQYKRISGIRTGLTDLWKPRFTVDIISKKHIRK